MSFRKPWSFHSLTFCTLQTATILILRVRPANYQSGWKLHGSDLRENRTVGSPWLVFHENGPYLVIWAFKKPKK